MKKRLTETSKTGAIAWLFQRITAVILFVLLIAHYIGYHFLSKGIAPGGDKITYKEVEGLMSSPFFNLIQFLFLFTALYHGINGVWMVVEDYVTNKGWRLFLYSLLIVVGISLLFVGILTILKVGA